MILANIKMPMYLPNAKSLGHVTAHQHFYKDGLTLKIPRQIMRFQLGD